MENLLELALVMKLTHELVLMLECGLELVLVLG
jgi:hypothetical protein